MVNEPLIVYNNKLNMLYKVSPWGYFGRVTKVSRGPWFNEYWVEDDGLERFYVVGTSDGAGYLLSNNLPIQDRERLDRLYKAYQRNKYLAWFAGMWLGVETMLRVPKIRNLAFGWKVLAVFGTGFLYKTAIAAYNGHQYGPVVSAYFRKYSEFIKPDPFQITDRKREFYEIDTSQYMNYDFKDLGHDYHANHGPQPDGEAADSSWLIEVDKFLRGEENKLKEHKNFVDYKYEFIDKSYPSVEAAHDIFNAPLAPPKPKYL
jgi:hypothetical protein